MELSEKLLCLFSAEVEETEDRFVVEVPRREIETGAVAQHDVQEQQVGHLPAQLLGCADHAVGRADDLYIGAAGRQIMLENLERLRHVVYK